MGGPSKVGLSFVQPPQVPPSEANEANGMQQVGENPPSGSVHAPEAPARNEDPFAGMAFEKLPVNVRLARQLTGYGAADRYRKLISEYKPQSEKNYDRNSYRGQYEMIRDAAVGFCRKFVESGLDAWCEKARAAGAGEKRIGELAEQIRVVRIRLTQHLTQELAAAHDKLQGLDPNSGEYVKAIGSALGDIKAALRNLRYRFDREHGLMTEYSSFKRAIGQFFSNSSRKDDREAAAQFRDLTALERELKDLGGDNGATVSAAEEGRLRELSEDSHTINEAIRNIDKSVDHRSYAFELAKEQILNLAKHGGEKSIDVSVGVGGGISISNTVKLNLMVKGHHSYRLHSTGDGSVTIEHLTQLGAGARLKIGPDNLTKVEIGGEFCGGIKTGNSSVTFKDVDSAARYMSGDWMGKLNPQTLYGSGGKIFMDALGAAEVVFKPFCWLGRNAAWLLGYDTKLDSVYGKNGEEEFVSRMTRGNILGKVAERILPGANILMSGKREYSTFRGNGEVTGDFNVGFANLKAGSAEEIEFQRKAVRTDYKPYMALLEDEMHGTMLARVEKAFGGGDVSEEDARTAELVFSDGDDLARLRDLMTQPAGRTPTAVVDALKGLSRAMDGFAKRVRNGEEKLDPAQAIVRYRATARVVAALLEMWEAIPAGPQKENLEAEYGRFSSQVRQMVTNPAVELKDGQIKRGLSVSRTEADDMIVNRTTVTFVYDAFGKLSYEAMKGNEILSGAGVGNRLARVGTDGALSLGGNLTGALQNNVEAEFVTHAPRSKHRRPWQNDRRTEVNLRLGPDSPVVDVILWAVGKAVSKRTKMDAPPTADDLIGIGKSAAGGIAIGMLKRLCKDFFAKPSPDSKDKGNFLVEAQKNALNVNASSMLGRLDILGGRNIQLVIEDGRLTGISFGDHSKVDVRIDLGAVVAAEGEFKMNSVVNRNTYALAPSFHSLLSKCDSMLRYGNQTNWEMYAATQRTSLVRMFDIVRNDILGGRPGAAVRAKDEKEVADAGQFRAIFEQMSADMARQERMRGPRGVAFQTNWETINVLLAEISTADGKADAIVKGHKMQRLLECITRHFNLVDMDLSAEEPLNPELAAFRDFAAENDNGRFKVASFDRGKDGKSAVSLSDDQAWRLQLFKTRSGEHVLSNRMTRSRLLKAILMEFYPEEAERWEHMATVMDFKGMLERIPGEIRSQMKPEDFNMEGKPLSAYRIGRIVDAVFAYRNGPALDKVGDGQPQDDGAKIVWP